MAISRFKTSTLAQGLPKYTEIWDQTSVALDSDYELIERISVGAGGASSITFSSIPSTYRHLQVRAMHLYSGSGANLAVSYNSGSFSNVISHFTYGNGGSTGAGPDSTDKIISFQSGATSTAFCVGIWDFLDYTSTNKNRLLSGLVGQDTNGAGITGIVSAFATNTSAINALTFAYAGSATFQQYTTFGLYGIKGA